MNTERRRRKKKKKKEKKRRDCYTEINKECTMRGCAECDRHHYCSSCAADFVNFFGKCIPSHPENSLEMPYTRKTVYSPPAILETSGTPPSARGTRPSHRTAGSPRTSSAPSAGPPRAPSAGPRRPPSSGPARTSSSAPPSSPPALLNYSRPSPALRVRPRRPEEKRPCRKKAAKKDKAGKDAGRRRDWKGRKKERQNKGKKGQKARRRGCRKRIKGRTNGPKTPQNATLPRGKSSPERPDGDSLPGETPGRSPSQGPPAATTPTEAPSRHGEQPPRDEHLAERRQPPEDPPDGGRKSEPARAPMLKGLRTERIRPDRELAGHPGKGLGKGGGRSAQMAHAGHRWQGLDADTRRRARARPSSPGETPKLPSRHKRRHKHDPRRRIPPVTQAKTRLYVPSV
ncbi:translation initiation factor IF-2-like isoform X2 [Penaeus chinensis]|uniref:translation initiation factor IF-2-like isoform X2 n=1 Tax=Penaeus chinensis TaxID=139456 RepID=UPI001FB731DD|nr:translation initiation factor IF-2-like isoform X2 [Penaeus chinensis]